MTSPVEIAFARSKVKPVAGGPGGVPKVKPATTSPAATPTKPQGVAPAGLGAELARLAAVRAARAAEIAKNVPPVAGAQAPVAATEPTGTDESAQAGQTQTSAPATPPASTETVTAQVAAVATSQVSSLTDTEVAFLKSHPDVEALIEKLAAQGK